MKRLFALIFIIVFYISVANAQNRKLPILYGIGTSSFTDVSISPVFYFFNKTLGPQQIFSYSYGTISLQANLILKEFNKNNSISLNVAPALRFTNDSYGFLSADVPVTINYNGGLFSTFNSDANRGLTVGLGVLVLSSPLIANSVSRSYGYSPFAYGQGCAVAGYRYWSRRSQRPSEVNLQLGYLQYNPVIVEQYVNTSLSFRLSFIGYINY
jgi:hypothetical protein